MDIYQTITIVTCITSTATLIIVSLAVLPHIKQGMVVVRDAILWVTFVLVVVVAGWLGWQHLVARVASTPALPPTERPSTATRATAFVGSTLTSRQDPYYVESTSD